MKIVLLGAKGQLGQELERQLSSAGRVAVYSRSELDITNYRMVADTVLSNCPNVIINAAAYTAVDKAESNPEQANAVNADAVAHLAKIAQKARAWLIHYSTDYVFDGGKPTPYLETDKPNPINVYGASKLAGELAIHETNCQHLIFRTTWVIGRDRNNFGKTILRLAAERDSLEVVSDQLGVPTSPSLITRVTIDAVRAIKDGKAWPKGIYNLVPQGQTNWHEIAQTLIAYATKHKIPIRIHAADVQAVTTSKYPTAAKRPKNSLLDTHKLRSQLSFDLPFWKDDFLEVSSSIVKELETL